jgi:hypothetical protein
MRPEYRGAGFPAWGQGGFGIAGVGAQCEPLSCRLENLMFVKQ